MQTTFALYGQIWYYGYMIEILLVIVTWYLTKMYYTRNEEKTVINSDLQKVRCSHCSIKYYTSSEHLRVPNLCNPCRSHV